MPVVERDRGRMSEIGLYVLVVERDRGRTSKRGDYLWRHCAPGLTG